MKSIIIVVCSVLALTISASLNAQVYGASASHQVGTVAYSGDNTPADIMIDHISQLREVDPNGKVSFLVTVPVIKKGKTLVQSKEGLPIERNNADSVVKEVTLAVPFETASFEENDSFDYNNFYWYVENTLERMRVPQSVKKAKGSMTIKGGAETQSNCGGYPIGSVITVRTESCLGTVINEYTCQSNPVTGGKDWYNTSVQFLPAIAPCLPGE